MSFTGDEKIQLDHALNIKFPAMSSSLDRALGKALKSLERACSEISRSITIVGYAAAAYLIMTGLSKLMEASRGKGRLPPPPCDDNKKRKKSKRNNKKDVDHDGREEGEETDTIP